MVKIKHQLYYSQSQPDTGSNISTNYVYSQLQPDTGSNLSTNYVIISRSQIHLLQLTHVQLLNKNVVKFKDSVIIFSAVITVYLRSKLAHVWGAGPPELLPPPEKETLLSAKRSLFILCAYVHKISRKVVFRVIPNKFGQISFFLKILNVFCDHCTVRDHAKLKSLLLHHVFFFNLQKEK